LFYAECVLFKKDQTHLFCIFPVAEVSESQSVNFDLFCEDFQHPTEEVDSPPNKQLKISPDSANKCEESQRENEKANEPDSKEEKNHCIKTYYQINSRCKFSF